MSLSSLCLALTLALFGVIGFAWVDWSVKLVYGFALATAVLLVIESHVGLPTVRIPRRQSAEG